MVCIYTMHAGIILSAAVIVGGHWLARGHVLCKNYPPIEVPRSLEQLNSEEAPSADLST